MLQMTGYSVITAGAGHGRFPYLLIGAIFWIFPGQVGKMRFSASRTIRAPSPAGGSPTADIMSASWGSLFPKLLAITLSHFVIWAIPFLPAAIFYGSRFRNSTSCGTNPLKTS